MLDKMNPSQVKRDNTENKPINQRDAIEMRAVNSNVE